MKYTGAKRMPLTPPTISETYVYAVFLKGIFLNFKQLHHYSYRQK